MTEPHNWAYMSSPPQLGLQSCRLREGAAPQPGTARLHFQTAGFGIFAREGLWKVEGRPCGGKRWIASRRKLPMAGFFEVAYKALKLGLSATLFLKTTESHVLLRGEWSNI